MLKNIVQPNRAQMTWRMYTACRIFKATDTYMLHLLIFHGNNGCTKAPKCYVICTLSLLLLLNEHLLNVSDKIEISIYVYTDSIEEF